MGQLDSAHQPCTGRCDDQTMACPAHRPAPHVHDGARARGVWLAVAGLVLLGACSPATDLPSAAPAPATPPAATASGATTTDCPESGVRISSPGVSAAMGLRALGLELVNCGTG